MQYLQQFRIVGLMGPRQSGKSTMIKHLLKDDYRYLTFDNLEYRLAMENDPVKFLKANNIKVIFDEAQRVPELFPALKMIVDDDPDVRGRFVVTGSGQFLLSKNISESLAGRIGLVSLLPMQYSEIPGNLRTNIIFNGCYPETIVNQTENTSFFFNAYIETYLQKDLRQMLNITDLSAFMQLVRLLATRVGQLLNISDLSKEIGITVATLSRWISVLEASYIVFLLRPFHANLGKRLVKTPKVYFYDNGLLCYLLGIQTEQQWQTSLAAGAIFENFIITDVFKKMLHKARFSELYFLRTSHGDEIDLIIDHHRAVDAVEIKMSHTCKPSFQKTLEKIGHAGWTKSIVYMGETHQVASDIKAVNFEEYLLSDDSNK
jgi:predicted AAA+ superfamily ATPase